MGKIVKEKAGAAPKAKPAAFGDLTQEQQEYIAVVTRVRKATRNEWRGMTAVPPNTLLDTMLRQFKKKTNIPLEIPFFTMMHYISAHLVERDVTVEFEGADITAEFWTIVLAGSGAGKTWTHNSIKKALGDVIPEVQGTGAASAAQWLKELEATNGKGLWIRDEFLQFLKAIESGGPLAEMKDYLLRIYDNASIVRKSKQDETRIDHPALSILGFNATESFVDGIDSESLVDGFAQRFSFVLANPDPDRPMENYPVWKLDTKGWAEEWQQLSRNLLEKYTVSDRAIVKFRTIFKDLTDFDLPESFYRRIVWRAHKYALIYHILRGDAANPMLETTDYAWAARAITLHIQDAADLLSKTGYGDLEKLLQSAERVAIKLKKEGKPVNHRALMQGVRGIKNAATAKFIFEMLEQEGKL